MNKTVRNLIKSGSINLALAKSAFHPHDRQFVTDTITLLDTGMNSQNAGDAIIMSYADARLRELFPKQEFLHLQTHGQSSALERARADTLKILCGTNILWRDMRQPLAWPILHLDAYRHSVCLMAAGAAVKNGVPFEFTQESKRLLKFILDPHALHSVRDENTKRQLATIGITNVINTACVTMWKLTPDFCKTIPTGKHRDVLTTVTDYGKDPAMDKYMLETLSRHYDTVYLWVQHEEDRAYASALLGADNGGLRFVEHPKAALDVFLDDHASTIDYFGTRLHAGIHSLNHGVRSMVVSIDNRARDIAKDCNLPAVEREDLPKMMESLIENPRTTKIVLPQDNIETWKNQFASFNR